MRLFKPNVQKMREKKDFDGLVKALNDRDIDIREEAARALGEMRFPRVVPPLCQALRDSEWTVRLTVIDALVQIGDARAIDPLVGLLKDGRPAVHQAAGDALEKFGAQALPQMARAVKDPDLQTRKVALRILGAVADKRVLPALCEVLKDTDRDMRAHAAEILGGMNDQSVAPALVAALDDTDAGVSQAAALALQKIGMPLDPQAQVRFAIAKNDFSTAVTLGAVAVEPLIAVLDSSSAEIRRNAARALGHLADTRALEPLAALLRDDEWYVREAVSWAIGRLRDPRVSSLLIQALQDPKAGTREAAAKALGEMQDPDESCVEPLIDALHDPELAVCEAAAESLSTMGPFIVGALLETYKESNSGVRKAIATAIQKIGVPDDDHHMQAWLAVMESDWARAIELADYAIEPLISALKDEDHRVRRAAAETLGQIGQIGSVHAITPLCEVLRDRRPDVRSAIADVLVKIGQPAVDPVIEMLHDKEWVAREAAAGILGQIGDLWTVGPLCEAMQDANPNVMLAAAEALDKIGLPEEPDVLAWHAVAKADWARAAGLKAHAVLPLIHVLTDVRAEIRWGAARALGDIGDSRAADALRNLMKDDEIYVREAAMDALAAVGHPAAPKAPTPESAVATEQPAEEVSQ